MYKHCTKSVITTFCKCELIFFPDAHGWKMHSSTEHIYAPASIQSVGEFSVMDTYFWSCEAGAEVSNFY